MSNENS